jgi:fructokinase
MMKKFKIIGIGEILWDIFLHEKKIGGAPSNFAYHVSALGHEGIIISRIGNDMLGKEIVNYLKKLNLIIDYIQIDKDKHTGVVNIKIDDKMQPNYIIREDVAWDYLSWDLKCQKIIKSIDAVCFGTLAQRNEISRKTIWTLLKKVNKNIVKVFDINLRQNFYNKRIIEESLRYTNILKLNFNEMKILIDLLELKKNDEKNCCRAIISNYDIELICLTKGEEGSTLIDSKSCCDSKVYPYKIADRVGAGDAFNAAMIIHYLKGEPLKVISEYANKLASWVTSKPGGMPIYDSDIQRIMSS